MKLLLLVLLSLSTGLTSYAASEATYIASDNPGNNPDANGNSEEVWAIESGGGDGLGGASFQMEETDNWAINDLGEGVTATHTFEGGALTAGQSVSIDYAYGPSVADGKRAIGIRFLDAGGEIQAEFSFLGGGTNGFEFGDSGSDFEFSTTGKVYDPNHIFTVTYTIEAENDYSATATASGEGGGGIGSWSGSTTKPIAQIQVFTNSVGNSIQQFNNLTISSDSSNDRGSSGKK